MADLQLDKLPRVWRFTLGERFEVILLDVLARLVGAAYSRDERAPLKMANLRLRGRNLWRLAHELQAISTAATPMARN